MALSTVIKGEREMEKINDTVIEAGHSLRVLGWAGLQSKFQDSQDSMFFLSYFYDKKLRECF